MKYKKNFVRKIEKIKKVKIFTVLLIVFSFSMSFYHINANAKTTNKITISKVSSTKLGTKVKWNKSSKYSGYIVYRSKNNGKFSKVATTYVGEYIDENIETGEQYSYQIKPYYYKKKKKIYGKISSASVPYAAKPFGVDNVSVVAFENYKVVSWDINELASGYVIYRKKGTEKWEKITTIASNTGIYEDYSATSSKQYQYKVAAIENVDGIDYASVCVTSASTGTLKGIDVSYHNGKIDWKKVKKAGISFAMIRLGYGTSKGGVIDSKLAYNYKNAKKNGIKVGLYLYSYADNTKEALKEAKFTYKMLQTYGELDYPISFDFENTYRNKKKYKKSNTKIITTYCDYLEKKGYDTSVYSYMDFLKKSTNYKTISKYGVWIARWTYNTKNFSDGNIPNVQMWQYSDKGKISGINSRVDLNLNIVH